MDDFSWGNTRVVVGEGNNKKVIMNDDEKFDESMIPIGKIILAKLVFLELCDLAPLRSVNPQGLCYVLSHCMRQVHGDRGCRSVHYIKGLIADDVLFDKPT